MTAPPQEAAAPAHTRESVARLYTLIMVMVLLWATNFVVAKIALREIPPMLLVGLRMVLAAVFILPAYLSTEARAVKARGTGGLALLLAIGLFGVGFNQMLFVLGISRTSVAHSAIIIGLTPLLVLMFASARGLEQLTARKLLGMATALAGVVFIQFNSGKPTGASLLGDALIFAAGSVFALYTVMAKESSSRFGPITVNTFAYAGSALLLLPFTLWQAASFSFSAVSILAWASLVYMAIFPSVVCYVIYQYALSRIPASRVSAFAYLQPVLATLLAVLTLHEPVTGGLVAGGVLVLAGVWITERA